MRYNGVRFGSIAQFHADPYEVENQKKKEGNWIDGEPYWIHGGSLSNGYAYHGFLTGGQEVPSDEPISRLEIQSRTAFWKLVSDVVEGYEDYKKIYSEGIENLIQKNNLDRNDIELKYKIYRDLFNL